MGVLQFKPGYDRVTGSDEMDNSIEMDLVFY